MNLNDIAAKAAQLNREQESAAGFLPFPTEGTLNSVHTYVDAIKNFGISNPNFYTKYLDHMKYFIGLFKFKNNKQIERLNKIIFRQLIEFGKVAISKVGEKYLVCNIVELKHNKFYEYTKITGMPVRLGGSVTKDNVKLKLDPDKTVIIFSNYDGFPFMYFWRDILNTIIRLEKTAVNGSILSMKKIKI